MEGRAKKSWNDQVETWWKKWNHDTTQKQQSQTLNEAQIIADENAERAWSAIQLGVRAGEDEEEALGWSNDPNGTWWKELIQLDKREVYFRDYI